MTSDPRYSPYTPEAWVRAVTRAIWRFNLIVGVIAASVYILFRLRAVIITLFVSAVLAYVMRPMAGWLARRRAFIAIHDGLANLLAGCARPFVAAVARTRGVPAPPLRPIHLRMHARRVFSTFYVLVLLFVGGWYAAKLTTRPFIAELANVVSDWPHTRERFHGYLEDANALYTKRVDPRVRQWIEAQIRKGPGMADYQRPLTQWTSEVVGRTAELARNIVEIVLLPVLAFYFALDSKRIKHEFVSALPRRRWREVVRMIHEFNQIMESFVVGQVILCTLAGVVVGAFLALLHVKYPVMLGLMAGFTRAIPIIGPIIGGIPIIFFALATGGFGVALWVLGFFTFMHFAESKFIMPLLIGDRMKLHPVVIIVVLLIGQEFGGLLGMFFAAPIAALVRVMVRRYWLRDQLGRQRIGPAPLEPEVPLRVP